jgi:hypothetical protein
LLADQVNAITALFAGRDLQVFTSGSEWLVTGDPLTPQNLQSTRQTRIGSAPDRNVPPVNIDGATIFAARNGKEMREFLFTDLEQAYGASDLALLSRHLINAPVDQAYDAGRRLLHVVMSDGSIATLTLYRSEQVTAWSQQTACHGEDNSGAGAFFRAITVSGGAVYVVIERAGQWFLARFDDDVAMDLAVTAQSIEGQSGQTGQTRWGQFRALDGLSVMVDADGTLLRDVTIERGTIETPNAVTSVVAGLPFAHEIAPLPPAGTDGSRPYGGSALRLISATFRLSQTGQLRVDTGRGLRDVPLRDRALGRVLDQSNGLFDGEVSVRALGWRRTVNAGTWRIAGDLPRPFLLLSVTSELGVND